MYLYTYIHMYIHTYVCTYVCMYVCMYTCMYVDMYVCVHVCMHVHEHVGVSPVVGALGLWVRAGHVVGLRWWVFVGLIWRPCMYAGLVCRPCMYSGVVCRPCVYSGLVCKPCMQALYLYAGLSKRGACGGPYAILEILVYTLSCYGAVGTQSFCGVRIVGTASMVLSPCVYMCIATTTTNTCFYYYY